MDNQTQTFSQETKPRYNFSEVISNLLSNLDSREQDVIKRRYELTENERETLEEIGRSYKITRERVRQIEVDGIKKLKEIDLNREEYIAVKTVEQEVNKLLRAHGGIMEENYLLDELLKTFGDHVLNRRSIIFMISQLLSDRFAYIKEKDDFHNVWKLNDVSWDFIENILIQIINILKKENRSLVSDEVLALYKSQYCTGDPKDDPICYLTELKLDVPSVLLSYLKISKHIKQNILGEWGLAEWNNIIPKRMNDKIYLVLKKEGKPLHFTDITKLINEVKFDKKLAQPATVHNELILDEKYVLVGRGIYGLKEWGYKIGTVTEVIVAILRESGPLSRDEIVKRALEQRIVRKTTINLSLSDKNKFRKLPTGEIELVEI
jgi:hypothetical protein